MDKVQGNLHKTVFPLRLTRPPLLPHWSASPPGTVHQFEHSQDCGPFFRVACPVSRWIAYITSKERREEDQSTEGTNTQGRFPRDSQGGQILSFRNKIIFRVRGPELDHSSRSKASPRCCCWMHSQTVWQTCESPPGRRPHALCAYPVAQGISRAGCSVRFACCQGGSEAFEPRWSLSALRSRTIPI